MTEGIPVITIDGPTASGKGTLAQCVAEQLGFHLLDSGALYRLVALQAQRQGVLPDDIEALTRIAQQLNLKFDANGIWLYGLDETAAPENVADLLRAEAIGNLASIVAAHAPVRAALLQLQRDFCQLPGLVADGRDMGTVVFPRAGLKVFLTASTEKRAERRYKQLIDKGFSANLAALLQDLQARDARDTQRASAPLKPAEGAKLLDNSNLTIEASVQQVLQWYREGG